MKKKKIIIYIPNLSGGGTERFFTQLAYFLSKIDKYSITFFYSVGNGINIFPSKTLIKLNKTISKKSFFSILEIIIFAWKNKSSLILTAQNNPNVFMSCFKFMLPKNTKLIISERSFTNLALKDSNLISSKIINQLIPLCYKNADFVHCLTERIGILITKKYNVPEKKIKIIPNFVDVKKIRESSNKKTIQFKFKYIISIGRLHSQKGYNYLLKAYSLISDRIPHKLVIVGDGPLKNEIKKQINLLRLEEKVILAGFIKNPYPVLYNADLFVLSSQYEGMPNVLLEAISLGVPIISSDCPSGPKEIIGKDYPNLLYETKDYIALSKLILKQLNFPLKIPQNFLEKNYSVQKILNDYDNLISQCLKEK